MGGILVGPRAERRTSPPFMLKARSSKLFILLTICSGVFTDGFLYGLLVPVMPFALIARVGVHEDDVQHWVSILFAVYGAAMLVTSPIAGWYADRSTSRRIPYLIGLVGLCGATLMLCLARSIALFIVGRLMQGMAAAVVWTVGKAILMDTYGQKNIGQISGYVSISMALSALFSPLLGGAIYDRAGYYGVYYLAFGLLVVDILIRLVMIERKMAIQWTTIAVQPISESAAVIAIAQQGSAICDGDITREHKADQTIGSHEKSQDLSPQTHQRAPPRPKYPPVLTLLCSPRILAALWGCTVQSSLMSALDAVVPLFVEHTFSWNSLGAGLVFLAIYAPTFASPLVGHIADRYGPRWLVVSGFCVALPAWVLLRVVSENTIRQKVAFCVLLGLNGFSLSAVMPPLMAEVSYIVQATEEKTPGIFGKGGAYAQAYGLYLMAFAAGMLIGTVWSGYIYAAAGWKTMTWTMGLLAISGAVPALIWTGGLITNTNANSEERRAIDCSGIDI